MRHSLSYGRLIASLSTLILALAAFIAAMLNPELATSTHKLSACIIPVQNVHLEPIAKGDVSAYSILYYKCGQNGCSRTVAEKRVPPSGGNASLGPSLIQTVMALSQDTLYPPTVMEALKPGVIQLLWRYPGLNSSALLIVESQKALLLLEKGTATKAKLVIVEGCTVKRISEENSTAYSIYSLNCNYNIAARDAIRVELVKDKLHGLVFTLEPGKALTCTVTATEVLYLKLPLLTGSLILVALAVIINRQHR